MMCARRATSGLKSNWAFVLGSVYWQSCAETKAQSAVRRRQQRSGGTVGRTSFPPVNWSESAASSSSGLPQNLHRANDRTNNRRSSIAEAKASRAMGHVQEAARLLREAVLVPARNRLGRSSVSNGYYDCDCASDAEDAHVDPANMHKGPSVNKEQVDAPLGRGKVCNSPTATPSAIRTCHVPETIRLCTRPPAPTGGERALFLFFSH